MNGELASGVRLIEAPAGSDTDDEFLQISSGIARASTQYPDLPYKAHAFVPKPPWRALSPSQRRILVGGNGRLRTGWIRVVRLPDSLFDRFEPLRAAAAHITQRGELRRLLDDPRCQEAIEYASRQMADFRRSGTRALDAVGVFSNPPGLPTATLYDRSGLNGLHIDSWYADPFDRRELSPGRMSINLGREARYFLYINLSFTQILEALRARGFCYGPGSRMTLEPRNAFMQLYPDYAVVKVRIRPGEAYVAPTENLLHDASTQGKTQFDIHLSARADFGPRAGRRRRDARSSG